MESMLGQGVSPLTSILHSILEWTGKESAVAMITVFIFCVYVQYHSGRRNARMGSCYRAPFAFWKSEDCRFRLGHLNNSKFQTHLAK
jgi:hypothetical protein